MNYALIEMAKYAVNSNKLLAFVINIDISNKDLTWEELALSLDITEEQLAKVALCRRPRQHTYADDVVQIATYVGMNPNRLGAFVTQIENSARFRDQQEDQYLLAARDSDDEDS